MLLRVVATIPTSLHEAEMKKEAGVGSRAGEMVLRSSVRIIVGGLAAVLFGLGRAARTQSLQEDFAPGLVRRGSLTARGGRAGHGRVRSDQTNATSRPSSMEGPYFPRGLDPAWAFRRSATKCRQLGRGRLRERRGWRDGACHDCDSRFCPQDRYGLARGGSWRVVDRTDFQRGHASAHCGDSAWARLAARYASGSVGELANAGG